MKVHAVTDDSFQKDVIDASHTSIILVDFWAEWCPPCRMLAPVLDEVALKMTQVAKVCKVNIDENQVMAGSFGIRSIPTVLMFKNGEVVATHVGVGSATDLIKWVEKHI